MFEVKTNLIRKSYFRADGKRQLKIVAKIGDVYSNKFFEKKRYEITILKNNEIYLVNDFEYERLSKINDERHFLYEIELKIKTIITRLITGKAKISSNLIFSYLYKQKEKTNAVDNLIKWNDFLGKYSELPANEDNIVSIENAVKELKKEQEYLTDEDISNIFDSIKFDEARAQLLRKIEAMNLNERYQKGHFNKNSIIELFGFCWSLNLKKNEPYVPDSYKSLILQLADYVYNSKYALPQLSDFNQKWVDNFLMYLIKNGYPIVKLKKYSPLEMNKHYEKLKTAKRTPYRTSTFQKAVKHLKQYIKILQQANLIPMNAINPVFISSTNYLSRKSIKENYTRRDHSLNMDELQALINQVFIDKNQTLARDMFIIQVFAGGLRLQELYDKNLSIQGDYISVLRLKTMKISINPIFPELRDVLNRNNNQLPNLLNESDYRKYLKDVADIMGWNRKIKIINTKLGSQGEVVDISVKDVFKPYSARKSIVNYLSAKGFTEDEIIEFTQHMDRKTLKHYKSNLSPEQKLTLVKERLVLKSNLEQKV